MSEAYELREEVKELVKSEDGIRGIVIGNQVYDPLQFSPEIVQFSSKQYKFLHAYRLGVSIQDAASKCGMSEESAERFLNKESTIKWLQDRALKDHIKMEWEEPGKWYQEMNRLYNEDLVPKHKIEILKEFGDRVCPKVSRNADAQARTTIEIVIDPGAIERSKTRRQTIEAEIIKSNEDPR